MKDTLRKDLAAAVADLLYPSESDAPIVPFRWKRTHESAREAAIAHGDRRRPVECLTLDEFFEPLLRATDGPRFAALKSLLEARLTDPTVVRIGSPCVTIYVIGRDQNAWAGVRTEAVET